MAGGWDPRNGAGTGYKQLRREIHRARKEGATSERGARRKETRTWQSLQPISK